MNDALYVLEYKYRSRINRVHRFATCLAYIPGRYSQGDFDICSSGVYRMGDVKRLQVLALARAASPGLLKLHTC